MKTFRIIFITVLGLLMFTASASALAINTNAANAQANAQAKLDAVKLKVCQNREAAITKRSEQLTKMATTMEVTFARIATRVENYYTNTVKPSGKTVSNYDALVADIAAKKTIVDTDLTKAQTDMTTFDCASSDPKGQLTTFRTDMQKVKSDLKDYRTSIKNLIVAVHGVSGTTSASTTN